MKKNILKALIYSLVLMLPSLTFADQVTVTVKGMVCSFCAQGIKKTFGKKDSVQSIDVDLDKKLVSIGIKKDMTLSDEEIKQTITDAGYEPVDLVRKKDV